MACRVQDCGFFGVPFPVEGLMGLHVPTPCRTTEPDGEFSELGFHFRPPNVARHPYKRYPKRDPNKENYLHV